MERPCGTIAELGRRAAALDLPVLSAALLLLTFAYGVRHARRNAAAAPRA